MSSIAIVIQARTGSTRWPAKVMADVKGKLMIDRVLGACLATGLPVIVAVPEGENELARHVINSKNAPGAVFFGSDNDLIDRYYRCAERFGLSHIVRVTADCPFHFPQEIYWLSSMGQTNGFSFLTNGPINRTTPDGIDCEFMTLDFLKWLHGTARGKRYREHLPLWVYEKMTLKPCKGGTSMYLKTFKHGQHKIGYSYWPLDYSKEKFSIDTKEDLEAVKWRMK